MNEPVLLTLGAEGALIDIDSTLFIQLVIFTLMALAATRWMFKPYLRMREQRTAGIEGARADAERLAAEAEARLADYDATLAKARARAHDEQRKIRAEASAHETELTDTARKDAVAALDAARDQVGKDVEVARAELMPKADQIAREMTAKLLGREVA